MQLGGRNIENVLGMRLVISYWLLVIGKYTN
jgi:hypothetical protein